MEAGSTKQLVRDGLFSLKTEVKMDTRNAAGSCGRKCKRRPA